MLRGRIPGMSGPRDRRSHSADARVQNINKTFTAPTRSNSHNLSHRPPPPHVKTPDAIIESGSHPPPPNSGTHKSWRKQGGGGGGGGGNGFFSGARQQHTPEQIRQQKQRKRELEREREAQRAAQQAHELELAKERERMQKELDDKMYTKNLAAVHDIEKLTAKKGANVDERFKITPDDEYPDTYMNREELRIEMNKKSYYYHDLKIGTNKTSYDGHNEVGQLYVEILQCFGLPPPNVLREVSAYCIAVCGPYAFKTDTMPPVANPMWLCRMRRACCFPLYHSYARLYIGVYDRSSDSGSISDFVGRIVLDVARLRPRCTYDVTIPLRQSSHIFERTKRGSMRVRIHLQYNDDKSAVLSYIPKAKPKFKQPYEKMTINCTDDKAFRDVAQLVHGKHMPGRFTSTSMKGIIREINYTQIHILRYIRKQELYNLRHYINPFISLFVFTALFHCLYANSVRYVPGHIITYILLHLIKNYAYYTMNTAVSSGFVPVSFEELLAALLFGSKAKKNATTLDNGGGTATPKKQKKVHFIEPLNMEMDEKHSINPIEHMQAQPDYDEFNTDAVPLGEVAESMRKSIRTQTHTYHYKKFKNCFTGTEAVDFLVTFGFAYSREEAVQLGKKLEKEARLFAHVAGKHEFDDKPLFYSFLEYDTQKYIIKGYEPKGRRLFELIGFLNYEKSKKYVTESLAHVPFPFATGEDHPRFTVKQSLNVRSSEAKKIQQKIEQEKIEGFDDEEDEEEEEEEEENDNDNDNDDPTITQRRYDEFGDNETVASNRTIGSRGSVKSYFRSSSIVTFHDFGDHTEATTYGHGVGANNNTLGDKYVYDSDGEDPDDIVGKTSKTTKKGIIYEEKILSKPKSQDLGVKGPKGDKDKSLAKTMVEIRHKVHHQMLHLFNDRTYRIDLNLFPPELPKDSTTPTNSTSLTTSTAAAAISRNVGNLNLYSRYKKNDDDLLAPANNKKSSDPILSTTTKKKKGTTPYDKKKDEYDKLLSIDKYSNPNNIMMNRIGVIVQPLLEIAQAFLFLFRSLFNIFTWQDPILTFWVVVIGFILVLILHFAPYRMIFGVLGIYYIGPQNWLIRVYKQNKGTYVEPDFDKVVKKKKLNKELKWSDLPFFSSETPGNRLLRYKKVDNFQVKQVIVPYSRLKYSTRFYDWPPEPEYARVYASPPPNEVEAGEIIQSIHGGASGRYVDEYWYDPTLSKKEQKKEKKKGLRKFAAKTRKGFQMVGANTRQVSDNVVHGVGNVVKNTTQVLAERHALQQHPPADTHANNKPGIWPFGGGHRIKHD